MGDQLNDPFIRTVCASTTVLGQSLNQTLEATEWAYQYEDSIELCLMSTTTKDCQVPL